MNYRREEKLDERKTLEFLRYLINKGGSVTHSGYTFLVNPHIEYDEVCEMEKQGLVKIRGQFPPWTVSITDEGRKYVE